MRDSLLDGFVEPLVGRMGLNPSKAACDMACVYGALTISSQAARFDIVNGLWFDIAIGMFISIILAKILMASARAGPSVLDTPLGYAHFGFRILYLVLFAYGSSSVLLGLAAGSIQPSLDLAWQAVGIMGLGCASASMYLGACRNGPPRPSRPRRKTA